MTITKVLQPTINFHFNPFPFFRFRKLSCSHMKPIGWKDMRVPSRAPMSDTSPPKTGMALAMTYDIRIQPPVQLSQTTQWVKELFVRWREPRRRRMKMYLAGSWEKGQSWMRIMGFPRGSDVGDNCHGDYESRKCQAVADFFHRDACRA
jgi:hypothetical protein